MDVQVASYDATGPHLYHTDPSGNYYQYVAMAIGAGAQSGKTYLEKHYKDFHDLPLEDLIKHSLKALAGCVSGGCEEGTLAALYPSVGWLR